MQFSAASVTSHNTPPIPSFFWGGNKTSQGASNETGTDWPSRLPLVSSVFQAASNKHTHQTSTNPTTKKHPKTGMGLFDRIAALLKHPGNILRGWMPPIFGIDLSVILAFVVIQACVCTVCPLGGLSPQPLAILGFRDLFGMMSLRDPFCKGKVTSKQGI